MCQFTSLLTEHFDFKVNADSADVGKWQCVNDNFYFSFEILSMIMLDVADEGDKPQSKTIICLRQGRKTTNFYCRTRRHDITPDAPSPNPLRTHKVLLSMSPREEKSCLLMKQMKKFVSRITSTVCWASNLSMMSVNLLPLRSSVNVYH